MGILRFAGASLSHCDKVNAGAKTAEFTSASQCQKRVLGGLSFFYGLFSVFNIIL
jgi:hypothetical protein